MGVSSSREEAQHVASSIGGGGETVRMRISFQPSSNAAPPTYQGKCVHVEHTHTIRNTHLADSTQDTLASLHRTPTCLFISYTARTTLSLSLSLLCARTVASGGEFGKNDGGFGFSRSPMPEREGGAALARDRDNSSRSHRRYAFTPTVLIVPFGLSLPLPVTSRHCLCLCLSVSQSLSISLSATSASRSLSLFSLSILLLGLPSPVLLLLPVPLYLTLEHQ